MPNYLGGSGPLVATDPNRFIQNYNQTRQVNNQSRQLDMEEKKLLLEEMQKKAEADKQRDIKEALEEASSLFGDEWGKIPDTLRYGYLTAVHAMDAQGAREWLKRIDDWGNTERNKAQRGQAASQLFPPSFPGPVQDTEALARQQVYTQGGMEDAKRYSDITRGPQEKEAQGFTLGPGQIRYGPNGEPIAEGPPKENEMAEVRREVLEETKRHNQAIEAINKSKSGGSLSFADKEALRGLGKQLPKTKAAAETAVKNVQKIDRMIALINAGAGGVRGELLAKINKVADLMRTTPPEDAKYNTLKAELRGFAGQLRLQLGLIGQTSDRDVAIMYEAAGGVSPAESQRAILEGYRQGYMQDINVYNSDAAAYSEYSSAARGLYRPMQVPATSPSPAPVPTSPPRGGLPGGLPAGTKDNGDGTFTLPNGKRVRPRK